MTVSEIVNYINRRITYERPTYKVFAQPHGDHADITILHATRDSRTGAQAPLVSTKRLSPREARGPADVVDFVRWQIGDLDLHERDEWLLVDGVRLFDPHRGVAA